MKGYFAMLAFKQAVVPSAVEAARTAQSLATGATPREHGHIPAWSADIPGYASMLGRRSEGVQWLTTLAPNWEGSHTQQDVLEQLFVDAALKAGSTADIRLALERVAGRRAILVMMALSALPASADQNFQL